MALPNMAPRWLPRMHFLIWHFPIWHPGGSPGCAPTHEASLMISTTHHQAPPLAHRLHVAPTVLISAHTSVHTCCSSLLFTPTVHTCCSHLLFTPAVHIFCSHLRPIFYVHTSRSLLLFTPTVHTCCSHLPFTPRSRTYFMWTSTRGSPSSPSSASPSSFQS